MPAPTNQPRTFWWDAARHADRRPLLMARNRIRTLIQSALIKDGFTDVEPAILQRSPGNEVHLHAFGIDHAAPGLGRPSRTSFLRTSPEFAMKKLLAAGETKIFSFAPSFRKGEDDTPLHLPEFTMLEWYRSDAVLENAYADCQTILAAALEGAGADGFCYRNKFCQLNVLEQVSVADAFERFAGFSLDALIDAEGAGDRDGLAARCREIGVFVTDDDTWSDLFSKAMTERIEPHLGRNGPTILAQYPLSEAALARPDPQTGGRYAERFELYVLGVELANGYGELSDADGQRARFEQDMDEKHRRYGERYPIDEELLAALPRLNNAVGVALGFDRLVMLATGAPRISDVRWTPSE